MPVQRKRRESGSSIVEVALLAPWIFFLFVGIFDLGFYAYAVICTENAARAAALQTASSVGAQSNATACAAAWDELKGLPNVALLSKSCNALPVIVTQKTLCVQKTVQPSSLSCDTQDVSGQANPVCADCNGSTDPNGRAASSQVAVQYQSIPLVPIPGILTGQITITRIAEMRIIAE
jgi:Flp pilus assembly protein TadG